MSPARALAVLTLVAVGLRGAALAGAWSLECVYDECFYSRLATALAAGGGFQPHAGHYWPPGYIAFLALHLAAGGGLAAAKVSQVLLSAALVPLVGLAGRQAAVEAGMARPERVGLLAAAVVAVHPTLIAFSHYLWSETLFLPIFTGGLLLVHAAGRRSARGAGAAAGGGLLLGASALIKVLPVYLVPLLAGWLLWRRPDRAGLRAAAMLVLAAAIPIAPWTARNLAVHGRLVLVETTTGKNLVRGNNPLGPANWDWGTARSTRGVVAASGCRSRDLAELDACLTRHGLGQIARHPGRFAHQGLTKLADLANPTSFLVRHIRRGLYGSWPAAAAHAAVTMVALFQMAVMALAVWGWARAPGPWRQLTGLLALYLVAAHVATFAMSRFRLPLEPLLAVGAALALAPPGSVRPGRRARLTAGVILALLLACWSVRVGDLYAPPPSSTSPADFGGD